MGDGVQSVDMTGNGNVVGDHSRSQTVKAEAGSTVNMGPVYNVRIQESIGDLEDRVADAVRKQISSQGRGGAAEQQRPNKESGTGSPSPAAVSDPLSESPENQAWTFETPTVAVGSSTLFFPGSVFPAEVHIRYAGGYEVIFQHRFPDDKQPQIIMVRAGTVVKPIVDADQRVIRFPKGTVWMTDSLFVPLANGSGRPDKTTWILLVPGQPTAQKATQEIGSKGGYLSQEFLFENERRVVCALNPANTTGKPVEVYFYDHGVQVQPIIDHDTKTVSFPP